MTRVAGKQQAPFKTPEQRIATTLRCATGPMLDGMGGVYREDADVAQAAPADRQPRDGVLPRASDAAAAERSRVLGEPLTASR